MIKQFSPFRLSHSFVLVLFVVLSILAISAPLASAEATRTWVSGIGDDANPCSRTAPCKTFAGAISKTADGGEINAMDPGGFGAVTITKSITIDATGVEAGVLVSSSNAIIINDVTPPAGKVVLRGLDIFGTTTAPPADPCTLTSLSGVKILSASDVTIADSRISGFDTAAIDIRPSARVDVHIDHVTMKSNCVGINAMGALGGLAPSGSASVAVADSSIVDAGTGVSVAKGGELWLYHSTIFSNLLGLEVLDTGKLHSYSNNLIAGNTVDGAPTSLDDPTPAPRCIVPRLRGKTLARATAALKAAHCRVGNVTRRRIRGVRVGLVVRQGRAPDTELPNGAKVSLVIRKA